MSTGFSRLLIDCCFVPTPAEEKMTRSRSLSPMKRFRNPFSRSKSGGRATLPWSKAKQRAATLPAASASAIEAPSGNLVLEFTTWGRCGVVGALPTSSSLCCCIFSLGVSYYHGQICIRSHSLAPGTLLVNPTTSPTCDLCEANYEKYIFYKKLIYTDVMGDLSAGDGDRTFSAACIFSNDAFLVGN